jgi:cytochrome c553
MSMVGIHRHARRAPRIASLLLLALATLAAAANAQANGVVERGAYLVKITACNDCHTPFKMGAKGPEPDMAKMLSGHPQNLVMPPAPAAQGPWVWHGGATNTAFAGPWGVSNAPNLTPDPDTGLGNWTEEQFVKALRCGRHMGSGRPILPPMPWPMYSNMNEADLKAVYAYLKSIPAIRNAAPASMPAPPPGS